MRWFAERQRELRLDFHTRQEAIRSSRRSRPKVDTAGLVPCTYAQTAAHQIRELHRCFAPPPFPLSFPRSPPARNRNDKQGDRSRNHTHENSDTPPQSDTEQPSRLLVLPHGLLLARRRAQRPPRVLEAELGHEADVVGRKVHVGEA